jgi:chromosome segregation protein
MSPVSLDFREGITAILGPNGCGKTNVVDAVRWVLGEQSARQLRSSKMENVIFNGTEIHKPLGYAVVNMTINNEKGIFPLDYSEITITRKVYRSGISEYFINKAPCRLKDIRELFADTGTGSHSYAVIEQEMVEYVLNDAHGERRNMFEEASGIVKYRMRREEALRKLKLTEGDLVRLEDILDELGKNVRSLQYQVGKTRRYRTLSERIRDWGLILLRGSLSQFLVQKRGAEADLVEATGASREGDSSLDEYQGRVEEEKVRLVELEKRNTDLQNQRYEIRRRIQSSEEKVIQYTERGGEAGRRIERAGLEIEEARTRLSKISDRVSGVKVEEEVTSERIAEEKEALRTLGGRFEEVSMRIERLQAELIDLKQTQLDFLQDQVRVKSSQEHYEAVLRELDERSSGMRERIVSLESETGTLLARRNESEAAFAAVQESLSALEKGRETARSRYEEVDASLSRREGSLAGMKTELAKLISRHELYQRMKENFEGFPGGARHVLKKGDSHVRGPLAEILRTDDRYRPALEAVLGGMTDGVVVDTMSGAMRLISELSNGRLGGARFFLEDVNSPEALECPDGAPGLVGRLSDFVDIDGSRRPMAEHLLGSTLVFETADHAMDFIASGAGREFGAVSLSGIYFCRGKGIYYAGAPEEEISLLGRAEEIQRMREGISALQAETAAEEAECARERGEKDGLRSRIADDDARISATRGEIAVKRETLQEIERDYIMKKEKCSLLMKSLDEIENSRVETMSKLEEARLALAMQQGPGDHSVPARIETELAERVAEKSDLETALTEKKIRLASLHGIIDKQREEIRGLGEMEKQFGAIVAQRTEEISAAKEESSKLAALVAEERESVRGLIEQESSFQEEIDSLLGILEEKRSAIAGMESDLKARRSERERIFNLINEVKIRLSTIDTRMRDLVEKGREVYGADLGCYLEGVETPLTEEERAVTPEMLDGEKRKLESLGPVNLGAIEEYDEKKERLDFLESQKQDLVKAKGELEEAITKINKKARSLFLETFNTVRGYFGGIFEVLFEGGEASLELSEGSDPLEADIIISARPKGKRLQDISLLSGGERALTAMALLFALYKAKPSPFCIFDEVDAPLDDANIQRFVRMLDKFSGETQFIIITHNKRTMEAASSLFGVTMEQKGVSKIVSVNLTEIEDVLENRRSSGREMAGTQVSSN